MRGNSVAILMIICGARSATAGVYCTAPEVPTFYGTKPTRPTIPFCLNEFVIENYNAAVDIYNREISEYNSEADLYIDELNRYVRDAQAYTRCEASNL
jgi:hypothetical protein